MWRGYAYKQAFRNFHHQQTSQNRTLRHSNLLEDDGELGAPGDNSVVCDGKTSIDRGHTRLPTHNRVLESRTFQDRLGPDNGVLQVAILDNSACF